MPSSIRPVCLVVVVVAACGIDVQRPTTWYQDVAPILAQHCMSCHTEGGVGPFSLTGYDDAREHAPQAIEQIERGAMPPFGMRESSSCHPRFGWVDDPRLSQRERWTLQSWIEQGYLVGDPAAVQVPFTELYDPSKTLAPVEGHVARGPADQFICYVLDPGITEDSWLSGLQVRPGVAAVVHHALIAEVPPGEELDQLVAMHGIGHPFDCGASLVPPNFLLHVWTPGSQPLEMRGDIGAPLLAGAKIYVQFHYHSHDVAPPDVTEIDLRLSTDWPERSYAVALFGNERAAPSLLPGPDDRGEPEFRIPRNAPDHVERMSLAIETGLDLQLFTLSPHMHYLGTALSATLRRPEPRGGDPGAECIMDAGWNFDWQRTYMYRAPLESLPTFATGDVLELSCRWDNTPANPFMGRWLRDANLDVPADIALGDSTLDEMCLLIIGFSTPAPPQHRGPAAMRRLATELTRVSAVRR